MIYDARPVRFTAQVLLDVVVVAGLVAAVLVGRAVTASVSGLAAVGGRVHEQGAAFEDQLRRTAEALGDVPFVGSSVSAPLLDASRSAGDIAAAGTQQQEDTLRLAHLLGTSLAVVLVVVLVAIWFRYRGAFVRRPTATRRLATAPDGTELLALRALTTRDAAGRLGVDVVDRWRRRDPETVAALADLELRSSGLRPAGVASHR